MEEWKGWKGWKGWKEGEDAPETRTGKQEKGAEENKKWRGVRSPGGAKSQGRPLGGGKVLWPAKTAGRKVKGAGSTPGTMQTIMETTRRNTVLKQAEPWEGEGAAHLCHQVPNSKLHRDIFRSIRVGLGSRKLASRGVIGLHIYSSMTVEPRDIVNLQWDTSCPFLSVLCCLLTVLLAIAST